MNGDLYVANLYAQNVTVINASTDLVVDHIPVGSQPEGIAFDVANGYLYVANYDPSDFGASNVTVIDGANDTVVGSVPVGSEPAAIALDNVSSYLAVANYRTGTISVLSPSLTAPRLTSVSIRPGSETVSVGTNATFAATPVCVGGPCPGGTTFVWTLSNDLGTLNSSTGSSTLFTAGAHAGVDALFVNASLNAVTEESAPASRERFDPSDVDPVECLDQSGIGHDLAQWELRVLRDPNVQLRCLPFGDHLRVDLVEPPGYPQ